MEREMERKDREAERQRGRGREGERGGGRWAVGKKIPRKRWGDARIKHQLRYSFIACPSRHVLNPAPRPRSEGILMKKSTGLGMRRMCPSTCTETLC